MRRLIILLLVAIPLVLAGLVVLALEPEPLVLGTPALSPAEVARVRELLAENDPRAQPEGRVRTATLSERDANLIANYLLKRALKGDVVLELGPQALALRASLAAPENPIGDYLNVAATLGQGAGWPSLTSLTIGRIDMPDAINHWFSRQLVAWIEKRSGGIIKQVSLSEAGIGMSYEWRAQSIAALGAEWIDADIQARIHAFQDHLIAFARASKSRSFGLEMLLQSTFGLAAERSAGGDPVAENRAALIALEAFVNRRNLAGLFPQLARLPADLRASVSLDGRRDFAQHFMLSAALVAFSDSSIAQTIGLSKEIDDSRGGSGFSFADLAADNAGTRFAAYALRSADTARRMQRIVAAGITASDMMPATADLPERLSESAFAAAFGDLDDPRFQEVAGRIDARIDALPLYSD
jgi:hypothetical protein